MSKGTQSIARRAKPLFATLVAYFPGLALPFAASWGLRPETAAALLLAYSLALAVNGTVGNALEMNAIARFSSLFSMSIRPSGSSVLSLVLRSLGLVTTVSAIIIPLTFVVVVGRSSDPAHVTLALAGLLPLPIMYSLSCTLSGAAIAIGQTSLAILSQALRALPPMILISFGLTSNLAWISLAFAVGELSRTIVLAIMVLRKSRALKLTVSDQRISTQGVLWQSGSTSMAQITPLVNRAFIVPGGPAAVIAYEIADRIFSAGNQTLTSGVLLPRLPLWARLLEDKRRHTSKLVNEVSAVVALAGVAAILGSGFIALTLMTGVMPQQWKEGARWGLLLTASLPFTILIATCSRILILQQRQRLLLPLVASGLGCNLVLNIVLYPLLGGTGIIVAMALSRIVLSGVYIVVLRARRRAVAAAVPSPIPKGKTYKTLASLSEEGKL